MSDGADDLGERLRHLGFRARRDAVAAFLAHVHKSRGGPTETAEQLVDLGPLAPRECGPLTRFCTLGYHAAMDAAVVDEFRRLLGQPEPEQVFQAFLEKHTEFIPREFVQNHGIYFRLVLRKLSFGGQFATDFFYLSKSSDDWNCVFIEIEKPPSKFFKEKSNEFHTDFRKALEQINQWRAWLSLPANAQFFTENTVGLLREPLHENQCFFKYVLVHGCRSEYEGNGDRKRLVAAQERDDFKILTFDSLLEYPHDDDPLYVASRNNQGISLLSEAFITDSLFAHVNALQIEVSQAFHAEASKPENWFTRKTLKTFYLEEALPHLRIR